MANPFSKTNNFVKQPKRNVFDLSFQNNSTFNLGALYPVMCKEVMPGDSFKIDPTFSLKFMPMTFPVQTRMNANLHFFYVRNRNLWKDWVDFYGKTKEGLTPPYIGCDKDNSSRYRRLFGTGSVGDYLGIPSTMSSDGYGAYGSYSDQYWSIAVTSAFPPIGSGSVLTSSQLRNALRRDFRNISSSLADKKPYAENLLNLHAPYSMVNVDESNSYRNCSPDSTCMILKVGQFPMSGFRSDTVSTSGFRLTTRYVSEKDTPYTANFNRNGWSLVQSGVLFFCLKDSVSGEPTYFGFDCYPLSTIAEYENNSSNPDRTYSYADLIFNVGRGDLDYLLEVAGENYNDDVSFFFAMPYALDSSGRFAKVSSLISSTGYDSYGLFGLNFGLASSNDGKVFYVNGTEQNQSSSAPGTPFSRILYRVSSDLSDVESSLSPYCSSSNSAPALPISAFPFRAYESIYNAFYRDIRNNPYDPKGNGVYEYNKYIPTTDGGRDDSDYRLRYRNWEQDFLTTAVQSPQQGTAPLVGVSGDGTFKFKDDDGTVYTAKAKVAVDGSEITGFTLDSDRMPVGNVQFLMDVASSGFTINDFRSVNSLQRWLETNMRKGLRYRDQIQAHYGVTVRYDELDMPEFIGGVSVPVMVNQISQTTPTDSAPLGAYAGQASCVGSGRSVSAYFDEPGFVMAIFSVTPVPNYSQLLPKMFLKNNVLDYFFPEFGHIGYQPVFYNEVCPLQAFNAGGSSELTKVFGYQRAWYEYLQSVDEVHGDFRLSLRDFLINRTFRHAPELSEEFLIVDPDQVNNVFTVTAPSGDKILGQIYFKIIAKRPIPMFGIPKLE